MGRGEHDHRRAHSARPDSEAESRRRSGHRRVSAEQDRRVGNMIRIVDAGDAAAVKALLWPERDRDGETEQRVSQIVADVRRDGESALLRYAREFDRLEGSMEISRKEMQAAARTVPARVRKALAVAA